MYGKTFKSDTMSVPVTCYGARFCYRYIALLAILCQHQYKASAFIRLLLYWLFDVKTCGQTYIPYFWIFCWKYFLRDISPFERGTFHYFPFRIYHQNWKEIFQSWWNGWKIHKIQKFRFLTNLLTRRISFDIFDSTFEELYQHSS